MKRKQCDYSESFDLEWDCLTLKQVFCVHHINSPPSVISNPAPAPCCEYYASLLRNISHVSLQLSASDFSFPFPRISPPSGKDLVIWRAGVQDDTHAHALGGEDTGGPGGCFTYFTTFTTVLFPILISIPTFNIRDWSHICIRISDCSWTLELVNSEVGDLL